MRSPARLTTTAFIFLTVLLLAGASGGLPVRGQTDGTPLLAGGNCVTYLGPTLPVQDALGDIAADIEAVWWLDPASSGWIAWSEAVPAALRGFAELEHGEAYFLIVSSAVTWTVPAAPIRDRNVVLAAGGNSVGYSGVATPVDTAFGGAFDQIESVWRFHAASQAWQGWSPALPAALVPFDTLEPGRAYWVVVAAAATWQQRAPEPDAPDADLLARTGVEWQRLETGDVFAAAIVTDAVAGPTGYLAVGYTDDDAAQPRAWHSADGVTWSLVPGDLGLPAGLAVGRGSAHFVGFPAGAVRARPLVVAADASGYVLAARRLTGPAPPAELCRAAAFLATSPDGLSWTSGGRAELGRQNQGPEPACRLPAFTAPDIPTDGELAGMRLVGEQVVLFGNLRWARAFASSDVSPAVWTGPRIGNLGFDTGPTTGFDGVTAGVLTPAGLPVLDGFDTRSPETGLMLAANARLAFSPIDALFVENRKIGITAMDAAAGVLVAVGTSEPLFREPGSPEFIAWRSSDGVEWTRDAIADDVVGTVGGQVIVGPAGPIAIVEPLGVSALPFVLRFTDGAWRRVPERVPSELAGTERLLATDWGVIAFARSADVTALFVSGAVPAP